MKSILAVYMVTNRSNMFVYKDDKKNIFYMKIAECIQNSFVSRQSSLVVPGDAETMRDARSPSVSSARALKKDSSVDDAAVFSRSNSVGESDKRTEDYIMMKVHGITPASTNVREDLVAVLQKKLDDKVVEVISTMLQRNSRCKLSSDDILFLQRPNSDPDKILRFTVNIKMIQYLQVILSSDWLTQ